MPLSVDMRKIVRAQVVPSEIADVEGQEDLYGIVYTTTEGREDGEPIGTKAEAEKIVEEIADQKVVAFGAAARRSDG